MIALKAPTVPWADTQALATTTSSVTPVAADREAAAAGADQAVAEGAVPDLAEAAPAAMSARPSWSYSPSSPVTATTSFAPSRSEAMGLGRPVPGRSIRCFRRWKTKA